MPAVTIADAVQVSDSPDTKAVLQADSTTKYFLPPRMTTAQKNAIASPAEGAVVFDTDLNRLEEYTGAAWQAAGGGAGSSAPADATYITQTSNGSLSNEQALASLSTGLVKVTTTTGVLSTAVSNTDYAAATHASRHESGGADALNGDAIEANTSVTNYTPSASTIGGHLEGIDDALGSVSGASYAILRHEETNTTSGGATTTNTWNACTLNTESYDPDSIVTISSNKFTPIAGTYKLIAFKTTRISGNNRLRLYNVTGTAAVKGGTNGTNQATGSITSTSPLLWIFTANGTDEYRFDVWVSAGNANGLGLAISTGETEVYLEAMLEKIA